MSVRMRSVPCLLYQTMVFFSPFIKLMAISCAAVLSPCTTAFTTPFTTCITKGVGCTYPSTSLNVFGGSKSTGQSSSLSPLPRGISPFEKSLSKNIDIQAEFRKRAKIGIDAALSDGVKRIEIEFPPLLGGSQSKSQFDDFGESKNWYLFTSANMRIVGTICYIFHSTHAHYVMLFK